MNENTSRFAGYIESYHHDTVVGYMTKRDETKDANIAVFVGETQIDTILPQQLMATEDDNRYCFIYKISPRYLDGQAYTFDFRIAESNEALADSPVTVQWLYESQYMPFATTDLTGQRVLALAPHHDDESFGCGGALALHRLAGDEVKVVILTDGSKGQMTQHISADYIETRKDEARRACAVLGVTNIEFWGIPDRTLTHDDDLDDRLLALLNHYQPDLIYAPSPLEYHPDHQATGRRLWRVMQDYRLDVDVAFWSVNRPLKHNIAIDITSVVEQKRTACDIYVSQLQNHPYTDACLGLNRFYSLSVSNHSDYVEPYMLISSQTMRRYPVEHFTLQQFLPATMAEKPLVSIIVRTQNRPALLREALSSLVTQSYPNIEVVVVNDGGEDIRAILETLDHVLHLRVIHHDEQKGRSAAANSGLYAATGKYIGFLDDDDLLHPHHIATLVAYLEATGARAVYSDCAAIQYHIEAGEYAPVDRINPYKGIDFDHERLFFENYIPLITMLIHRDVYDLVGDFDETLEVFEDWDYWLRLSEHVRPQRIPQITAEYRFFKEPSHNFKKWRQVIYEKYRDHWTISTLIEQTGEQIAKIERDQAQYHKRVQTSRIKTQQMFEDQRIKIQQMLEDQQRISAVYQERVNQLQEALAQKQSVITKMQAELARLATQFHAVELESLHLQHAVHRPKLLQGIYRSLVPYSLRVWLRRKLNAES
ncbi:MAG: hypothetical protein CUN54_00925 [Phototrophicales bacterium]|nr:MAG: hypothetical protein CUN54_00925 [Phototrophicales bacterium]